MEEMKNKINEIPKREKEQLNQTNKIKEEKKGIINDIYI